jgi:hypothetical protein
MATCFGVYTKAFISLNRYKCRLRKLLHRFIKQTGGRFEDLVATFYWIDVVYSLP